MSRKVRIIVPIGTRFESMVASGVCQALKSRPGWVPRLRYAGEDCLRCIRDWKADVAIIGAPGSPDKYADIKIPVVRISGVHEQHDHPSVLADDMMVGSMGAEYLLNLNLKNFAFWAQYCGSFARRRKEGFFRTLKAAGVPESNIYTSDIDVPGLRLPRDRRSKKTDKELRKWLIDLPKPIGVLSAGDQWGYYLIDLARDAGIDVPNDIAMLGVDNDELLCELTRPSMSAIALATNRIGYEAVRILDDMLKGKPAPSEPVLVPPIGVVSRGSTDMLAIDDPDMIRAITFIRTHATDDISVGDLLKQIPIARRTLEAKFNLYLNRSPGAEIRRLRLEKVRHLLTHTAMLMPEIARQSGFSRAEYMATFFTRETGMSPSAYRRKVASFCEQ